MLIIKSNTENKQLKTSEMNIYEITYKRLGISKITQFSADNILEVIAKFYAVIGYFPITNINLIIT